MIMNFNTNNILLFNNANEAPRSRTLAVLSALYADDLVPTLLRAYSVQASMVSALIVTTVYQLLTLNVVKVVN